MGPPCMRTVLFRRNTSPRHSISGWLPNAERTSVVPLLCVPTRTNFDMPIIPWRDKRSSQLSTPMRQDTLPRRTCAPTISGQAANAACPVLPAGCNSHSPRIAANDTHRHSDGHCHPASHIAPEPAGGGTPVGLARSVVAPHAHPARRRATSVLGGGVDWYRHGKGSLAPPLLEDHKPPPPPPGSGAM